MDLNLANRIQIETQLLSEEKWLLDTLKKIQLQRHSLQIERLHLQSVLSRLLLENKPSESRGPEDVVTELVSEAQLPVRPDELHELLSHRDLQVNEQELNLNVSTQMFQPVNADLDMEEDEEEDDCDNYDIDMNMFMNGEDIDN